LSRRFAAPARFAGKTFEIASDSVTGRQLEALFSAAAGRPIPYSRFSDEVLAASPFLHKLTGLVDDGRLAGMPTSTPCASCIRSCTPSPAGWRAPAVPPSSGR
jgi:hypothetical protein